MRSGRQFAATLGLAAACVLALAANAGANHSFKEELSIGPSGGNGAVNAFFDGASQDGTRAFFETSEALVSADTDTAFDIYERVGNTTNLVSTGPSGGNGPNDAFFDGVSADGTRVFFDTDESLVAADTDTFIDVYQRSGGVTTLVSTGPAGGNGDFDVTFDGISKDGSHVFFETDEVLVSGDTNDTTDIFDRSGGTTKLITTGTEPGIPIFDGSSDDGTHVFYDTDDSVVAGDTDVEFDVYERFGASTTLLSIGPSGGNAAVPARWVGNSQSGARVWFETAEKLVAGDTDSGCDVPPAAGNDVYERSGGTTTQVSVGGNGTFDAFFDGASGEGAHVVFHSTEPLAAGDTDTRRDVFDRTGGTTVRVSTGTSGGNGAFDAIFAGMSLDGSRIWLETNEPLEASDTDTRQDVYERAAGTTTNRISTGTSGGNAAFDAFFDGASLDGVRVFFSTSEPLESTDTDTASDGYERFAGGTTHVTYGPNGGNAALGAFFDGASADGSRVFFNTRESLITGDTDTTRDVYAATTGGYARPRGATPLRVSLVPAFLACASPNRTHGAPLSYGSCNPPAQASGQLTVGSPDANGAGANFQGSAVYSVIVGNPSTPANEADVQIAVNIVDVRQKVGLADYTGQLQVDSSVRITDHRNGTSGTEPGTGTTNFPVTVPCVATGSTTVGGTCALTTTFNSVMPGAIVESQRSIWQMAEIKVFDGGPDGVASTAPNTLFADQGVFVP
jgi:hypothetical protein